MKRSRVFLLCILVIALAILWAGLSNHITHRNVIIHATIDKVAAQFTDANKWLNWHPDLMNQATSLSIINGVKEKRIRLPDLTYIIKEINPAQIKVYEIRGEDTTESLLTASPYKDGTYSYVDYVEKESGFAWISQLLFHHSTAQNLLNNLRSFTEDDSRRYGFLIKIVPVADTLILTTSTAVAKDSVISNTFALYHRLMNYCKQHSILPQKPYYYTSTATLNNNQVQLSVGAPVQKRTEKQTDFAFLKLPANGHLVVGEYKGLYKNKQRLYAAMDEYVQDRRMKKVAQPLEQYMLKDTSFTDTSNISFRVFYPVF